MIEEFSLWLSTSRVFMNILFRRGCPILFSFQFPFGFLFCPSAPIFTLGNRRENTNISCNSSSQENVCKPLICIILHCIKQDRTHISPVNSDLVIQLTLSPPRRPGCHVLPRFVVRLSRSLAISYMHRLFWSGLGKEKSKSNIDSKLLERTWYLK